MKEKKMTRREAMARLTKIVAMAAGLSVSQVRRLFGQQKTYQLQKQPTTVKPTVQQRQIQKTPNLKKLERIKPLNEDTKLLKVLLHNNRSVFESEFGRLTPRYKVRNVHAIPKNYRDFLVGMKEKDIVPGMMICPVECSGLGGEGNMGCGYKLVCGENLCINPGDLIQEGSCNYCNGDECNPRMACNPPYHCDHLKCGDYDSFRIEEEVFSQNLADPYVKALFQEFNVKTSNALASEIKTMLSQRRQQLNK